MDQDQMLERCPNARLIGVASLSGYRLGFTIYSPTRKCGCADIISSKEHVVYGLLYELTLQELFALDEFEGAPVHYRRIQVSVYVGDESYEAYAYEVVQKSEGLLPSEHYLGLIQKAAKQFSFPENYQINLTAFKYNA